MLLTPSILSSLLFATAFATPTSTRPGEPVEIAVPGTNTVVRTSVVDGAARASVSRDGGRTWRPLLAPETVVQLHYARFDPVLDGEPFVPDGLRARPDSRLFLVQFETQILDEYKVALARLGAERRHVVPDQAFVVRMGRDAAARVAELPFVRWVGDYHPAYRLEEEIVAELIAGSLADARDYNVVMVDDSRDRAATLASIEAVGGTAQPDSGQGILQVARLTGAQLLQLASADTVLWIDRLTAAEEDIQNARIQGGANYVESVAGIDGKGVTGMVAEGIYGDPNFGIATHPEFAAIPPYRTTPISFPNATAAASSGHGNSTAGEIYARGGLNSSVRGLVPFAQPLYCNYNYVQGNNNRKSVTQWGISTHGQMIETASWGYGRVTTYDSRSAEMDDIIFDLDMVTTQSQSNANSQASRPQAWAKNIIAIGGVAHRNTATPTDDGSSGASYGPSADLRQKPDLCAYYDSIDTTGSTSTSYTTSFGGTSGATPMVNGFCGIVVQMFAEGHFGYPGAASWQNLALHKPHFTTAKALLAATSYQYATNQLGSAALTRARQGWGFPDVRTMFDQRDRMLVSDEDHVLRQGQVRQWLVFVPPGTPEFRVSMSYADPEANPAVTVTRQNSVDLDVVVPDGTAYWGNHGMTALTAASPANYTLPGGSANDRDTTENVFLQNPAPGLYRVSVRAAAVRVDGHVETGVDDVDFGIAISGIAGSRNRESAVLDLDSSAPGSFSVSLTSLPSSGWVDGYTCLSADTGLIPGNGNFLGVELDGLVLASLSQPAGGVFHFTPGQAGYPGQPYSFPAPIASLLSGVTLDAIAVLFDSSGGIAAVSNVDRVTVQ